MKIMKEGKVVCSVRSNIYRKDGINVGKIRTYCASFACCGNELLELGRIITNMEGNDVNRVLACKGQRKL